MAKEMGVAAFPLEFQNSKPLAVDKPQQVDLADASITLPGLQGNLVIQDLDFSSARKVHGFRPLESPVEGHGEVLFVAIAGDPGRGHAAAPEEIRQISVVPPWGQGLDLPVPLRQDNHVQLVEPVGDKLGLVARLRRPQLFNQFRQRRHLGHQMPCSLCHVVGARPTTQARWPGWHRVYTIIGWRGDLFACGTPLPAGKVEHQVILSDELATVYLEQLLEMVSELQLAARIVGVDDAALLEDMLRGERLGDLTRDQKIRLGYVHSMYLNTHTLADLRRVPDTDEDRDGWVADWCRQPLDGVPFNGRSPIDHWLLVGRQGMAETCQWQVDEMERLQPGITHWS